MAELLKEKPPNPAVVKRPQRTPETQAGRTSGISIYDFFGESNTCGEGVTQLQHIVKIIKKESKTL